MTKELLAKEVFSLRQRVAELERSKIESGAGNVSTLESSKFLSNVLNSIQDGVSVLDGEMHIIYVNRVMEQSYAHALPVVEKMFRCLPRPNRTMRDLPGTSHLAYAKAETLF